MADTPRDLELSSAQMRALADAAMARIVAHIEALPTMPAADAIGGAELARALREPLPEEGAAFESLLDMLFDRAIPRSFNTAGPGYLAYIPGGGIFHAALADLIANTTNRFVGVFQAAPGLAQLEANVVRWFCEMTGLPATAGGFLTTGGSLANFSAIVTARCEKLPEDFLSGTIYTSEQAHHSVARAALLAGFPRANIRPIPVDAAFRIQVPRLREVIDSDARAGFKPFLIVGNAGTTNTGAVDDLPALAALARERQIWLHVDGAYGGFFVLTARGRAALRGMEQADSITLDPHKALFLPYGTGCLLVRDVAALRRTHSHHAAYLPQMQRDADLVDFTEISPELSRDFRGLRCWLPLKMHGAATFRRYLDEKLDLARWAAGQLHDIRHLDMLAEPQLSLLAFRLAPPGRSAEQLNALNRELLERINARKRVFLTGTLLGEVFALRICVLSFRTHQDRMNVCLEDIRASVADVLR